MALFVVHDREREVEIRGGQNPLRLLGPFNEFQARVCKEFPQACILPLAWIVEAVKIKVKNGQSLRPLRAGRRLVRLHHRVAGAFDASGDPQRPQQVAHKGGLARPHVALQRDGGVPQCRAARQPLRQGLGVGLGVGGFYNVVQMFDAVHFVSQLQAWGRALGFAQIGVAGVDLSSAEPGLLAWLAEGRHGDMHYMASHGLKRARPAELVPGTLSVITARMDYLPAATPPDWQAVEWQRLQRADAAAVSLYARGRDYHKVLRQRLQKLADQMALALGPFGHRVFTDSAPVLEAELASRSGQGWRGKHTLVLNRAGGSMFFLGEILVDVALPATPATSGHCGQCQACISACPTGAITAPYQLDARRCISYLTIEHAGPIPEAMRSLLGNRIYGCDDCQLICPWNKFAQRSTLPDFEARPVWQRPTLVQLFAWSEDEFLRYTEGSPIRRIGHERWLRNLAVALGNALRQPSATATERQHWQAALQARAEHPSALVREHVCWALQTTAFEPICHPDL